MRFDDQEPIAAPTQRVLVVGAGPVGHALASALSEAGFPLRHWSRARGPLWEEPESGERKPADIVLLAVRDEAIAQAARYIVEHRGAGANSVLLHCAGALPPAEVLAAERASVRGIGMLHPLHSFVAGEEVAAKKTLRGVVFAVSGDEAGQATAQALCEALGGVALPLAGEQQAAYHAAAVMAAGHVAALIDVAAHVLANIGLHRPDAERALAGLTRSVVDNIERVGLPAALTGPFARGDGATVARHIASLSAISAEAEAVYRSLGPSALDLAYRKGSADSGDLDRLAEILFAPPARGEPGGSRRG
jgi:predicted short-subunit dehydrogenase-like oxidoreductase (DUF2520 family)